MRDAAENVLSGGSSAGNVLIEDAIPDAFAEWSLMAFYAVADALNLEMGDALRRIEVYRFAGSSARTDKQVGASSSASGTTTLNVKPGLQELLGLALEHGAITQEVNGTGLTLSSSPYALIRPWVPDTQENFTKYSIWRSIGVSATFRLDNTGAADFNQLSEWSLRFRVFGDRSIRSRRYTELWQREVGPLIREALEAELAGINAIMRDVPDFRSRELTVRSEVADQLAVYLSESRSAPSAERSEKIAQILFAALRKHYFDPVKSGEIALSPEWKTGILEIVGAIRATQEALRRQVPQRMKKVVDEMDRTPILTLDYTNHSGNGGSRFSELKLLLSGYVAPFSVVFNGGVQLYHDPDSVLNQSTVKNASVGLTLEGAIDNFLVDPGDGTDLSKITLAADGRYERLEAMEDDIWVAQIRLEIPIKSGLSFPLSVSYASRTELIDEDEVRGHFGFTFDIDKFFAATRATLGR